MSLKFWMRSRSLNPKLMKLRRPMNEPENPFFDEQQDANDPITSVSQLI
ncbi:MULTISPECIES: hypothetical protein [Cyanophyceae]|nr:hypothetical protein [Trichocoleus sp. FACHB-40]MBD2003187.1 hypothetical protein [Trichocoleus sp. FACHB-40]